MSDGVQMHGRGWHYLLLIASLSVFAFGAQSLRLQPRHSVSVEMEVAMPRSVQVTMSGGDRFLAANIAAVRALSVHNFKMGPDQFRVLARVQEDVAWFNPGHEDNYYVASAILPWHGEVDAAQNILRAATRARPFDYQPAFYYGFNQLHFLKDPAGASKWMRDAADSLPDEGERLQMQNLAAIWLERAEDPGLAIRVVEAMAQQATRSDFRKYLIMRASRLKMLMELQAAVQAYRNKKGHAPTALGALVVENCCLNCRQIRSGSVLT